MPTISKRLQAYDVTFETEIHRVTASVSGPADHYMAEGESEDDALSALQKVVDISLAEQDTDVARRMCALAARLDVYWFQIEELEGDFYGAPTFEIDSEPGEYAVLTPEERDSAIDAACDNYIDEAILPEIPEAYQSYFDSAAWKRDVRLGGFDDSMISTYDGCVSEQQIDGEWYYVVRTN